MEKTKSLNEKLHVPDVENATVLIDELADNILKYIDDNSRSQLYLHDPRQGDLPSDATISGSFFLSDIENPCTWLAGDNMVEYTINFDEFETRVGAGFGKNRTDTGYVESDDDGNPVKVHLGLFIINIDLAENMPHDIHKVEEIKDLLSSALRHEIGHAHKELKLNTKFGMEPDVNNTNKKRALRNDYKQAYFRVHKALIKYRDERINLKKSEGRDLPRSDKEKLFMALYSLCYSEKDAHISGFYQRVIDDLKRNKKLRPIQDYYEYDLYKKDAEFIKDFDNVNLFKENVGKEPNITGLFGPTVVDMRVFKKKLFNIADEVLRKLEAIYSDIYQKRETIIKSNVGVTVNEAQVTFDKNMKAWRKSLYEGISTNEYMIIDIVTEQYASNNQRRHLAHVDYFFNGVIS